MNETNNYTVPSEQAEKGTDGAKAKKSIFQIAWSVFTWVLVIAVILLAVALVGVRLLGYTPYAILSPSMTPEYQVGDLVYVKEASSGEIAVGDVITYVANKDLVLVTHRVDAIDEQNGCLYTKGDANKERDASAVYFENIVGVVKFSLPKLGNLSIYLATDSGKYVCIAAVLLLLLLFLVPELIKAGKTQGNEKKEECTDKEGTPRA